MSEKEKSTTPPKEEFINPIDIDKVAENPHLLPYAHTVGGAVIKPIDKGRTKGLAVEAMREQTHAQLKQLQEQMQLLANQAQGIQKRIAFSEMVYEADMNFKPIINHVYHLYQRADETALLSLVGPNEWGKKGHPFNRFLGSARLQADHTWQLLEEGE